MNNCITFDTSKISNIYKPPNKMKTITTLLLLFTTQFIFAQGNHVVNFRYDPAGNRNESFPDTKSAQVTSGDENPRELLAQVTSLLEEEKQDKVADLQNQDLTTIQVYPNPATEKITLTRMSTGNTSQPAKVILLNSQGKIMAVSSAMRSSNSMTFDVASYARGVYYVYYVAEGTAQRADDGDSGEPGDLVRRAWLVVVE